MTLTEKVKTLSTLDDEIANLLEDEGTLAEDIEQSDEYKQKIYAVIVSIDKAIAPPAGSTFSPGGPVHTLARVNSLPDELASRVRLPKLTLRPFDGDITKWTSF